MLETLEASVGEVGGSDGVEVINIGSEGVENLSGQFWGKRRDFHSISSNTKNILVVHQCILEMS